MGDAKNILKIEKRCQSFCLNYTKNTEESADVVDSDILVFKFIVLILLIKK